MNAPKSSQLGEKQGFGTAPVFFTAISTILGAIMFLRFGYAVGNVGLLGGFAIILVGHIVTIPTAMAIAEIATNQKVEGSTTLFRALLGSLSERLSELHSTFHRLSV